MATEACERAPRICFVAPAIYSTVCPDAGVPRIGGAELQQTMLGGVFAAAGMEVTYVTLDHGQPDKQRVNGATVIKSYREQAGIPGVRFFYPRVPKLWRALARADADVYYVRGAGYLPGLVARFCRRHGRRLVFATASDANVDPSLPSLPRMRDRCLYRHGLRRADAIVVQSNHQADELARHFGLSARVIRNVWHTNASLSPSGRRELVLWVSMFRELKQPEHFLRLAKAFPDERFVMIGGPLAGTKPYFERVRRAAEAVANLEFLGYRTFQETEAYFERAKLLVNTSRYEGFPNTFLQAWSRGVPVLSYVDPDDLIVRCGLGAVAASEGELGQRFGDLLRGSAWDVDDIVRYFNDNHAPDGILACYQRMFTDLDMDARHALAERQFL